MDWPELKYTYFFFIKSLSNLLAEHIDIGLIYLAALVDQGDCVIYRDLPNFILFLFPVFV